MNNFDEVLFFLFIFSILIMIRSTFVVISALYQNPPQKVEFSDKALIILGISISYFFTYLIKL